MKKLGIATLLMLSFASHAMEQIPQDKQSKLEWNKVDSLIDNNSITEKEGNESLFNINMSPLGILINSSEFQQAISLIDQAPVSIQFSWEFLFICLNQSRNYLEKDKKLSDEAKNCIFALIKHGADIFPNEEEIKKIEHIRFQAVDLDLGDEMVYHRLSYVIKNESIETLKNLLTFFNRRSQTYVEKIFSRTDDQGRTLLDLAKNLDKEKALAMQETLIKY